MRRGGRKCLRCPQKGRESGIHEIARIGGWYSRRPVSLSEVAADSCAVEDEEQYRLPLSLPYFFIPISTYLLSQCPLMVPVLRLRCRFVFVSRRCFVALRWGYRSAWRWRCDGDAGRCCHAPA